VFDRHLAGAKIYFGFRHSRQAVYFSPQFGRAVGAIQPLQYKNGVKTGVFYIPLRTCLYSPVPGICYSFYHCLGRPGVLHLQTGSTEVHFCPFHTGQPANSFLQLFGTVRTVQPIQPENGTLDIFIAGSGAAAGAAPAAVYFYRQALM
jgi:hypothetical protein